MLTDYICIRKDLGLPFLPSITAKCKAVLPINKTAIHNYYLFPINCWTYKQVFPKIKRKHNLSYNLKKGLTTAFSK